MRTGLALLLLLGCDSTTFVDCPTFGKSSCVDADACRYVLYGDGSGECRNTCDPFADDPCPDGFDCALTEYWDPATAESLGPLTDLCID